MRAVVRTAAIAILLATVPTLAPAFDVSHGGHVKLSGVVHRVPSESILRTETGSVQEYATAAARLNLEVSAGRWDFQSSADVFSRWGEFAAENYSIGESPVSGDRSRWMNLTSILKDEKESMQVVRLDRFSVGYSGLNWSWRLGRQALSWGNGVFFHPMDILNPFSPVAVDTEYKTGDDMLYGQYLMDTGDDLQVVHVVRRNLDNGEIDTDVATTAIKFHRFMDTTEFDLLIAEHYGESAVGLGISKSIGGAIWRGDWVWTDEDESFHQFVTNVSYAWNWWDRNFNGSLEYFYNGLGVEKECNLRCISADRQLSDRLARGESYAVGRHYVAGSVTVEISPLTTLTPTLIINAGDQSVLAQVNLTSSVTQNSRLLVSITQPIGPSSTEYGGLKIGDGPATTATGISLFAQFSWYF